MGVILSATDSLNWFAKVAGASVKDLTADLGSVAAPGRTLFMPYLGGERTPYNDAQIRAVMEGVTLAFRDSYDALTATGTRIDSLLAVGGGSNSDYWVQAIATAIGMPISIPEAGDFGGALGGARLGMLAAGAGIEIATAPPIAKTLDPIAELQPAFAEAQARYRTTYAHLKGVS